MSRTAGVRPTRLLALRLQPFVRQILMVAGSAGAILLVLLALRLA
jgi:hypothetical protein